jgi:DNA helicase-2/ATP-dependent DNA helicase PcrA
LVIKRSGLASHYQKDKNERAEDRIENLEELIKAAAEFKQDADDELPLIHAFIAHAALEAGEGQVDGFEDGVQLMTLHAAKGLEFPAVFLVGLEEGLFPHQRSSDDPAQLEEERRLCYVGITRAKERVFLSYAETRRLHGSDFYPRPSRFIREIPATLIEEVRLRGASQASRATLASDADAASVGLKLGQRVFHNTFGEGVVLYLEGRGEHTRVQVNFEGVGAKWLVAAYAGLQAL